MKKILFSAVFVLLFVPSLASAADCTTIGAPLVDATQQITNDVDSGKHGYWAFDNYTRTIRVWLDVNNTSYCAQVDYNGTFDAPAGVLSPEAGQAISQPISGTMVGGYTASIVGTLLASPTIPTTVDYQGDISTGEAPGYVSWLAATFAPGYEFHYLNDDKDWSWTYKVDGNNSKSSQYSWINAGTGSSGDISPVFNSTTGTGYFSVQSAIDAANPGDTILLGADITTSAQINVNKAITFDGNGHTLRAAFAKTSFSNNSAIGVGTSTVTIKNLTVDGAAGTNLHGINIYLSTDVSLESVSVVNTNRSGLVVNGSTVTATNLNTSGNGWNAVNIDPGSGVNTPSVFTLNSGTLGENIQIWSDGKYVTETANVTVTSSGYVKYPVNSVYPTASLWANKDVVGFASITRDSATKLYTSIQSAIDAADSGEVINVASGTYNETLVVNKNLSLRGPNYGIGSQSARGTEAVINGMVQLSNGPEVAVTFDGFTVNGPAGADTRAIAPGASIGSSVLNNIVNVSQRSIQGDYYGRPSNLTIRGNTFNTEYGIAGTEDISSLVIENNVFNTTAEGVGVGEGAIITSLSGNKFLDAGVYDWRTVGTSTIVASHNWWGTASSTVIAAKVSTPASGTINFMPWYINPGMTTLSDSISGSTVTVTQPKLDFQETTDGGVTLPEGVSTLTLSNDSVLSFASSTNTKTGTDIVVGGATTSLTTFTIEGATSTVDLSVAQIVGGKSVTIEQAVTLSSGSSTQPIILTNSSVSNISVSIPDTTTILAPSGWDGTIAPPQTIASSGTAPSGFSVGSTVISVGSPNSVLIFDKPVTITLEGVTGAVGYKSAGSDQWMTINTTCTGTYDNPTGAIFPGECKISNGTDTKILTYHFTTFGSLSAIPAPVSSGGSYFVVSGTPASNTALVATLNTPNTTGEVLGKTISAEASKGKGNGEVKGVSTYAFGRNMRFGARGVDVEELQKMLIAAGHLKLTATTQYFGPLTKAAVIKWQAANKLPATGFFGPMSRALTLK